MPRISKKDQDLLAEVRARFVQSYTHEAAWREEKQKSERYYDGNQLSDKEKQALKRRNQPEVVINKSKIKIDSILGIQRNLRVRSKAFRRGERDDKKAQHISESFRYIEDFNSFDLVESEAFAETVVGGRSWYYIKPVFDGVDVEIGTEFVEGGDVYLDPYCKKADLSDAKFLTQSIWIDVEDAKEMFPKFKDQLDETMMDKFSVYGDKRSQLREYEPDQYDEPGNHIPIGDHVFFDKKRKRIRLMSHWYKEPYQKRFIFSPREGAIDTTDMQRGEVRAILDSDEGSQEFTEIKYRVNHTIASGNLILEKTRDIKPSMFPWVLVPCYVEKGEKKRPYSYMRQLMSPQDEINKRRSKMLHLLNVNRVIREEGAVENVREMRAELAKPDGDIVIRPGAKFEVNQNIELAQSQFLMLQEAQKELEQTGVSGEVAGQPTNAESGRAIQFRIQQSLGPIRPLFDNLRQARKRLANMWFKFMREYWKGEKLIKITDDQGVPQELVINQRVYNPDTQKFDILNDISVGKYDIIVEEVPDTVNLQSDQFNSLMELARIAPEQIPFEMILEASTLPNKERLLAMMEERKQQQMAMQQAAMQAGGQLPLEQ
jgi:hypothetical protein